MPDHSPTTPSRSALVAEEYELPTLRPEEPVAGPSRPRRTSKGRTLTIHANPSSSVLFSATSPIQPRKSFSFSRAHHRSSSIPEIPPDSTPRRTRAQFLHEHEHDELDFFGRSTRDEEVHVPDFGHMLGINPGDEDHYAIANGMRNPWKRKLYLLMEEPSSGREAFFVHIMVTGGILFSALLTILSTLPAVHTDTTTTRLLFGLDTTIVVLFTIEYLTRSLAHSDSLGQYYNWATSFFAILDFIAIFPYYIEVARKEDTSTLFRFSILRTFRLLRVFRAFKYQNQMLLTIEVMYVAVQRSKDALVALAFFILLVLVLFSTLIYFAERGTWDAGLGGFVDADGDPSMFDSIPKTAWFSLVTMTTTGYGDVVPRSFLGKLLTTPLLMFGLLLIALPSFVLGRNFAIVFDAMNNPALKPSVMNTPRESMDEPPPPPPNVLPPPTTGSAAPLLPMSASDSPAPYAYPGPSAQKGGIVPSGSGPLSRTPVPKMWDGDAGETKGAGVREKDLTNTKLAKNQLVLLEQIDSLRQTIDRQGEMLSVLLSALNKDKVKDKAKDKDTDKDDDGNGVPPEYSRKKEKEKGSMMEEQQFAIADDSDDDK